MKRSTLFLCFLQLLSFSPSVFAVKCDVINNASNTTGGRRFTNEIGANYTKEIMKTINYVIWDTFQQYNETERKQIERVKVYITEYKGAEAMEGGKVVNVSSIYLEGYQGNLKWEFTSLLHHEMTHVFQENGMGKAPIGLIEGIADYMILRSNYYPLGFAKPGQGDRWDQGYDFTARFLEYCEDLKSGFVAGLNRMMKKEYSDDFFIELTSKPLGQLWSEYKAKYKKS